MWLVDCDVMCDLFVRCDLMCALVVGKLVRCYINWFRLMLFVMIILNIIITNNNFVDVG